MQAPADDRDHAAERDEQHGQGDQRQQHSCDDQQPWPLTLAQPAGDDQQRNAAQRYQQDREHRVGECDVGVHGVARNRRKISRSVRRGFWDGDWLKRIRIMRAR